MRVGCLSVMAMGWWRGFIPLILVLAHGAAQMIVAAWKIRRKSTINSIANCTIRGSYDFKGSPIYSIERPLLTMIRFATCTFYPRDEAVHERSDDSTAAVPPEAWTRMSSRKVGPQRKIVRANTCGVYTPCRERHGVCREELLKRGRRASRRLARANSAYPQLPFLEAPETRRVRPSRIPGPGFVPLDCRWMRHPRRDYRSGRARSRDRGEFEATHWRCGEIEILETLYGAGDVIFGGLLRTLFRLTHGSSYLQVRDTSAAAIPTVPGG